MPKILIVSSTSAPDVQHTHIPLSYLNTLDKEDYIFEVSDDELNLIRSFFKRKNTCYEFYHVYVLEQKYKFEELIDEAIRDDLRQKKKLEQLSQRNESAKKKREESRRIKNERKDKQLYESLKNKFEIELVDV
jgi:hypothetical protein